MMSFLLNPSTSSISSFACKMCPILVELADINMMAVAEFSPNVVYSLIGIAVPLLLILFIKIVFAFS
jgi:hypothetical protein